MKEKLILVDQVGDGNTNIYDVNIKRNTDRDAEVEIRYSEMDTLALTNDVAIHLAIYEGEDIINITFDPEGDNEKCIALDWAEIEHIAMMYKVYNEKLNRFRSNFTFLKECDDS